jgi:membrane protein implicated in regulation of membrane protease activity
MISPVTRRKIWGTPIALGAMTTFGMLSALLGDGTWDFLSWLALSVPVGVIVWHVVRSASETSKKSRAF